MACVGTPEQFMKEPSGELDIQDDYIFDMDKVQNVDFGAYPDVLDKNGFKNDGKHSYVISPVDNKDKFSKGFVNCTGLLVAGKDKNTGEDVSLLSHENPGHFLNGEKSEEIFSGDIRNRLNELKERCIDGTIDAIIVGGNYFKGNEGENFWEKYQDDYFRSVGALSKEVLNVFNFEPIVITGPKRGTGIENVFYDNKNRRLYIMRPEVGNGSTESFVPSDIGEQEKKW